MGKLKNNKAIQDNLIWIILVVMVIVVGIFNHSFLTINNALTLLSGEACKGIMAFGVMFAILSRGIDIGVSSTSAFVAVVTASLVQPVDYANKLLSGVGQMPAIVAWIVGLAMGAILGAVIGAVIAYTKIPPFIATLGVQLICRAAAKLYTQKPVSNLSDGFRLLGSGKIGSFPIIIIVFFVMYAITAFLLTQTRWGANVYAVGGNDQAARVAGINVEKTLILVYAWSSVCAAIAGMLLAGRSGSADPANTGLMYETDAIAAATVGGTSHSGGIARISGVLAGILVLGVVNNALVMLKVDDNTTNIVKGLIIIGSVAMDMRKNAKKA